MQPPENSLIQKAVIPKYLVHSLCNTNADIIVDIPECTEDVTKPRQLSRINEMGALIEELFVTNASRPAGREVGEKRGALVEAECWRSATVRKSPRQSSWRR